MKSSQPSYPNRPAAWRISPECCRLINDRHRRPEAFALFLRLRREASRHKESRELRESSLRRKKCPDSPQTVKNTKNKFFLSKWWKQIGLGRQSQWNYEVYFFVSLPSSVFWAETQAHMTLSQYLQLRSGCCFGRSRAALFLFLYIRLAVRHSVIRQNEDFPPNEAHAKSDIIQSGPFSSAFVWCFLLLFWTFLWFQWWLKNLKWHNSVASVWRWGCNPNGFSAEKSLKTHTHLNLALGATGFKPQR